MKLFKRNKKQNLNFGTSYFVFNECMNFTIRRGIKTKYKVGEDILLTNNFKYILPNKPAKITDIQHIKYCDIPSIKYWHLNAKKDIIGRPPGAIDIMKRIYGDNFNENEIVTLIWFKLLE